MWEKPQNWEETRQEKEYLEDVNETIKIVEYTYWKYVY